MSFALLILVYYFERGVSSFIIQHQKHLCMGKVYQPISRKRQIEYADNFRSKFKELLSLNHAKKLISDISKINIDRQGETNVITAKSFDFETLYAEYIAELKRRKIYCRFCKNCGKATLFYSKNKMLCDSCYTANRRNAPIEHKKRANSDSVLRSHKSKIQQYYNYSHSVHFKNSSPEQQQAFLDFFADFKAEAKVLLKKYRNGEIKKKEMDKWFIKQNDIYTKIYNSSGND